MTPWVLLRGLTREAGHWGEFASTLSAALHGAPVTAIDLPGAGERRGERCPLRVEAIAATCRERWRAASAAPRVCLLGLSLGGMVAAAWAERWPAEVAACVLVNTSLRPFNPVHARLRPRHWPTLLDVLATSDARRAEGAVLQLTSSDADRHRAQVDAWVALRLVRPVSRANALRQLVAAARYRHPGRWPPVPLMVAASAGDRLVDPACSAALARQWGAVQALHPRAGHDLPLDDGPWLAAQIADWWLALDRRGGGR